MSTIDRRAINREYKETPRPAGIYRVRNTVTGKSLIGATMDLPSMLNRQRFQLESGGHPDRELQQDWRELGSDAFEFGVLDELELKNEPGYDPTDDLAALKQMWIEELTKTGEALYRQSLRASRG